MSNTNELGFKAGICGCFFRLTKEAHTSYSYHRGELKSKDINDVINKAASQMGYEAKYFEDCSLHPKFKEVSKDEFFIQVETIMPGFNKLREETIKTCNINKFLDYVEYHKLSYGKEYSDSRKHDEMLERQAEREREQLKLKNWKDFGFKPPIREEKKSFFSKLFAG